MFYLQKDEYLKNLKNTIFDYLKNNYDIATAFINRLEGIRAFYAEDTATEDAIIEDERGN